MLSLVAVLLLVLAALVVFVRLLEPRFAFFPSPGETMTPRDAGVGYAPLEITTRDGERLRAWKVTPAGPPRARVLYFHGNGGNLSVWTPILAGLARHGYAIVAIDYRGYGASSGRPSERGLYRDVDATIDLPWSGPERGTPLVYWGRSLGSTMAAYAAASKPPDGLVLESAFPDARSLVSASPVLGILALFSTYRFPTAEFLKRSEVPLLVMHGDADQIVPFHLGRTVYDRAREPKRFFTIRAGDHNDAAPPDPVSYWNAVADFITTLGGRT